MALYDSYVICTSLRSGSTLLCLMLAATEVAGNPASWFHEPSIDAWLEEFNLPADPALSEREVLASIFRAAIAKGSLDTGMFGLRLQRHSFAFFSRKLAILHPDHPSDLQRFEAAFGKTLFIYLSRRDKIGQAISYVRAQQSGLWHMAPDGSELERLSPPREPVYDGDEIRDCLMTMQAYDQGWEDWFKAERIEPVRITYEELSADPGETLRLVMGRLALDPEIANEITPGVKKLADETSRDWATRFAHEQAAKGSARIDS